MPEQLALRRRVATWFAVPYLIALVAVGFWPRHVDSGFDAANLWPFLQLRRLLDIPRPVMYEFVEFSANVVWFVPLGIIVVLWLASRSALIATAAGFAGSLVIELGQAVVLPGARTSSAGDVVANTLGALIGALLALWWSTWQARRRGADGATPPAPQSV